MMHAFFKAKWGGKVLVPCVGAEADLELTFDLNGKLIKAEIKR